MDNHSVLSICKLITILTTSVVKDNDEWHEWGLPFVGMVFSSQFGLVEGEKLLTDIESKFCPMIGHGNSLLIEYCESDDFTIVHNSEDYISCILQDFEENVDVELLLSKFLENFLSYTLRLDAYDARSRTVAKRMCIALDISAAKFSHAESLHMKLIDSCAVDFKNDHKVKPHFSSRGSGGSTKMDSGSLVASFRLWRVAFIAAGGGAMMAVASKLAAPTIMETILPLLCATTTVGQVSLALNAILATVGLSTTVVPYLMGGAYGAAVAGLRMLKRTEPLKEFIMEPLHVPIIGQSSGVLGDPFASMLVDPINESTADDHLPVFILVSGHVGKGVDPRSVWGANGLSFESAAAKSSESTKDEHHVILSVVETAVELAEDTVVSVAQETVQSVVSDDLCTLQSMETTLQTVVSFDATASRPTLTATDAPELGESSAQEQQEIKGEGLSDWEELQLDQQSGWWKDVVLNGDEYILYWDRAVLESLNESFQKLLADKVQGMIYDEVLKFTPVHAIKGAAHLPMMVLGKLNEIDDPWVVAMDRARQAGVMLARILIAEHHNHARYGGVQPDASSSTKDGKGASSLVVSPYVGSNATGSGAASQTAFHCEIQKFVDSYAYKLKRSGRPVTLVGYGMGARLIFHCLETLAAEGGDDVSIRGIVETAVLIGAPIGTDLHRWKAARSVVAGRLINCYSTQDWLLAILYRSKSYELGIAGLAPIILDSAASTPATASTAQHVPTPQTTQSLRSAGRAAVPNSRVVENVDVTGMISSHSDYPIVLPRIISMLNL